LEPDVLLLDEPTSGLDPTAARAAEALLRRELERGAAVVLVSHDPDQVARLADARMEMSNGVLARAGADDVGDPAP
ncbi:MAG TPA: ABC transporter ATP-binding protein, partial [Rhodospirillales bacterium]|nr:ABC transporter ATP-binding protein [Rhodospirillales bacterium]